MQSDANGCFMFSLRVFNRFSLRMGECPAEIVLRFVVGQILATDICWQLLCLKLALNLCDTLGAFVWPGCLNFVTLLQI